MGKPGKTKMVKLGPQQKYGLKMDHGAKQMNKPGLHKHGHYGMQQKYGMHQESVKQERKNLLKDMPVDDRAGTKQMKTGLYQDRNKSMACTKSRQNKKEKIY